MGPSRGASRDQVKLFASIRGVLDAVQRPLEPGLKSSGTHAPDERHTKKNYKVSLLTTDPSSSYRNDAADSSSDVSPSS